jgi:hypothetical protein
MAKALTVFVTAALLASIAFAQCATVSGNVYRMSTCAGYTACTTTLCTCAGNAGTAETCLSSATANCAAFTTCTMNYFKCLDMLAGAARSNTSDPCNSWAVTLHAQLLTATVGTYNGSALQTACGARACALKNATSLGSSCSMGTNWSSVCMAPVATTTTAAQVRLAIRAQLRLAGNWTAVLGSPAARAALETALKSDLGGLLGVATRFIRILGLTSGSLIVDFAVEEGSGVSNAALETAVGTAATNTNWLSNTQTVATANGGPTSISVTSAGVTTTTTAAPAGSTTTAAPSSSAAHVSAAAVAVAALLALVL